MKFIFFGSSQFSIHVLNELEAKGILPFLVVTVPDKPKGRKLILTPNSVKAWAEGRGIKVIDPKSLKKDVETIVPRLTKEGADFFLVTSYGKIIPAAIFDIPKHKTLNIHPSILPKYRGASPIISQILNDENEIGVSIMQIDEGMDTGLVVGQRKIKIENWPISAPELEKIMARESAELFVEIIDKWLKGEIKAEPQDDSRATICGKIEKEDGLLDLDIRSLPTGRQARKNLLKIKAFAEWPRAYFFIEHSGRQIRVIITGATIKDEKLKLLKVIPEGKPEMSYEDFLRGYQTAII